MARPKLVFSSWSFRRWTGSEWRDWTGWRNSRKVLCFVRYSLTCSPRLDFRHRFLSLLSFKFREFGSVTALSILEAADQGVKLAGDKDEQRMFAMSAFSLA